MVDAAPGRSLSRGGRIVDAYAALSRGDPDTFCRIHDAQVITVDPALGNPVGTTAVLAEHRSLLIAFPDLRYSVEQVIDAPPYTVARLRVQGTHRGAWGRHRPTGRLLSALLCEVCEWMDDGIVTRRRYWDRRAALAQLGLA